METRFFPLVAAALALLAACSKEAPPPPPPQAAEVTALTVKSQEVPVVFEFVGQTESSQQVEIRSRVVGFLEKRVYTEGAMVKEGQVMFLIDRKPFDAELQASRAELAQQQARLTTARANLARVKPLVADNALSAKDLDDAVGAEQTAAAAVEAARAKVTDSSLSVGYTTIKAPVSGLSSFAKVQEGAYVDASNSLLTYVAKLDPMRVNFSLSENEALRSSSDVAKGLLNRAPDDRYTVEVVLADGTVYPAHGRIVFADAAFSQETGTFLVRAEVPNPKGDLRPGQFVRVKVHGFTRPHSIVVPQRAIQEGPRGAFVWLVDKDGKAAQRNVEAGEWIGENWLVSGGLKDGERVVVDGVLRLAPGVPMKVADAPPVEMKELTVATAPGGTQALRESVTRGGTGSAASRTGSATGGTASAATRPGSAASGAAAQAGTETVIRGSLLFAQGSAKLDAGAQRALKREAERLKARPTERIVLSGYVSSEGDSAANVELAKSRAIAARDALVAAGIKADRIELKPPADIVGGADPQRARRVDIVEAGTP